MNILKKLFVDEIETVTKGEDCIMIRRVKDNFFTMDIQEMVIPKSQAHLLSKEQLKQIED